MSGSSSLRSPTALMFLAVVIAQVAGCAGQQLARQARELRGQLAQARQNGAYRCAPRALAMAEAHADFATRELDQGDYFRARDHLRVAEAELREALRLSPPERCMASAPGLGRRTSDSDGDGISDRDDRCPADAEDKDGFQDEDGCPEVDNDNDGIVDTRDRCPRDAEDVDGFEDQDGCPDEDNDKDGVADAKDRCPVEREDADGFEDADGCPDPDNDQDGYADVEDQCPREPGPPGGNGCPPRYTYIEVTREKIELKQTIFFRTGKAAILSKSYPLLDEVAVALTSRPRMRVRIEGHTDSRGARTLNIRLSQARADAVKAYLVGHGVGGERLEARGFGPDQPIETNKTAAGREKNRRVEFLIVEQ